MAHNRQIRTTAGHFRSALLDVFREILVGDV
jgi:hypothetical protein